MKLTINAEKVETSPEPQCHKATLCEEIPRQLERLVLRHVRAKTEEDQFPTQPRLRAAELLGPPLSP